MTLFCTLRWWGRTCQLHFLTGIRIVCRWHSPRLVTWSDLGFVGSLGIIDYLFRNYTLGPFYVWGPVLATGNATMSKNSLPPCPLEADIYIKSVYLCVFNQSLQKRPWVVFSHWRLKISDLCECAYLQIKFTLLHGERLSICVILRGVVYLSSATGVHTIWQAYEPWARRLSPHSLARRMCCPSFGFCPSDRWEMLYEVFWFAFLLLKKEPHSCLHIQGHVLRVYVWTLATFLWCPGLSSPWFLGAL